MGHRVIDTGLLLLQVMPQTEEVVGLVVDTNVPVVVAITKSDMVSESEMESSRQAIEQQLAEVGLVTETFGGDAQVQCDGQPSSADVSVCRLTLCVRSGCGAICQDWGRHSRLARGGTDAGRAARAPG